MDLKKKNKLMDLLTQIDSICMRIFNSYNIDLTIEYEEMLNRVLLHIGDR